MAGEYEGRRVWTNHSGRGEQLVHCFDRNPTTAEALLSKATVKHALLRRPELRLARRRRRRLHAVDVLERGLLQRFHTPSPQLTFSRQAEVLLASAVKMNAKRTAHD